VAVERDILKALPPNQMAVVVAVHLRMLTMFQLLLVNP
jgi:hypothetical protein